MSRREPSGSHINRRPIWTALVATALAAFPLVAGTQDAEKKTVRLTIDYGDGVQKTFGALPWQEKMTVLGALEAAAKHPRGIRFEHRGRGASAFITSIDDLTNEGPGRNWTYQVNDARGAVSAGALELKPGDSVLWRFGGSR